MNRKIRVGVLFGGQSAEHEVSLQSARNVVQAIDSKKYEVTLIGIDKGGQWYLNDASQFLLHADNPRLIKLNSSSQDVALIPGKKATQLITLANHQPQEPLDVIFPVLHGPFGEDGTVQGLLKLAGIPFVGASVLGSAIGMDKDIMKRLLREAGIPTARFLTIDRSWLDNLDFDEIKAQLGCPLFVKPANLGSSVGVSKVKDRNQFEAAVRDAFHYDHKILIEEYIAGREIECSVLGNETPIASVPGEVMPQYDFYSYEAKYIDENGAILEIPARLPPDLIAQIQSLAIKTFKVLCCEGMARVDFFLRDNRDVIVNELNTIPGFTNISMYPKLWEVSGLSQTELIDRLIQLALERFDREKRLHTSFDC